MTIEPGKPITSTQIAEALRLFEAAPKMKELCKELELCIYEQDFIKTRAKAVAILKEIDSPRAG